MLIKVFYTWKEQFCWNI